MIGFWIFSEARRCRSSSKEAKRVNVGRMCSGDFLEVIVLFMFPSFCQKFSETFGASDFSILISFQLLSCGPYMSLHVVTWWTTLHVLTIPALRGILLHENWWKPPKYHRRPKYWDLAESLWRTSWECRPLVFRTGGTGGLNKDVKELRHQETSP